MYAPSPPEVEPLQKVVRIDVFGIPNFPFRATFFATYYLLALGSTSSVHGVDGSLWSWIGIQLLWTLPATHMARFVSEWAVEVAQAREQASYDARVTDAQEAHRLALAEHEAGLPTDHFVIDRAGRMHDVKRRPVGSTGPKAPTILPILDPSLGRGSAPP